MNRAELRSCLASRYSIDELKTQCFDAGIDYQEFPTDKIMSFVRELVLYCERNGKLEWIVGLCIEKGGSSSTTVSTAALKTHDYEILSDCHTSLYALRNVFEERLPVPQLREHHVAQVKKLALQVLMNPGVLKRIMGPAWAKELGETVAQVVVLDNKLAGRDILKEVEELKSRSPDEPRAFFGAYQDKKSLMERLERLILDLEARLK